MSMQASSDVELQQTKAKSAKEIANYFGVNSSLPVFDDEPSARRATYDLTLKKEVEGDQEQFKDSAASQASALTSFLQLRGLNTVRVLGISVACGAGFTPEIPSTDSTCVPCSIGTYKRVLDNSPCVTCPVPMTTNFNGATDVSACTEWAGQRLPRKTAEKAGYVISAVVGSVVGINSIGAVVGVLSALFNTAIIGDCFSFCHVSSMSHVSSISNIR